MTKLWTGHNFAARSCCDLDLQGIDPNVVCDTSSHYGDNFCKIVLKSNFKKPSYGGNTMFGARSCCDLDLQGRDLNLARDMLSQYGDHFCKIVFKTDCEHR